MAECYDKDPTYNVKCIVFTILVSLGYWYLPRDKDKKPWIAIAIAVGWIITICAYDYFYVCSSTGKASCLKYLVIPIAFVAFYWYAPPRNKWILALALYFPYLLLAWYDYLEGCKRNMGPTFLSLQYAWAKPKDSVQIQQYDNWCPDIKKKVHIVDGIIALAILVAAPFFWKWNPK